MYGEPITSRKDEAASGNIARLFLTICGCFHLSARLVAPMQAVIDRDVRHLICMKSAITVLHGVTGASSD
jgi:hypothetical protein